MWPEFGSLTFGSEKASVVVNSSMGVATPACQMGGQRTPPWAETEPRKAKGRRAKDIVMLLLQSPRLFSPSAVGGSDFLTVSVHESTHDTSVGIFN